MAERSPVLALIQQQLQQLFDGSQRQPAGLVVSCARGSEVAPAAALTAAAWSAISSR